MRTIWKWPLRLMSWNELAIDVDMPAGAELVTVAVQHNTICIWALVDPEQPAERRRFKIVGTGHQELEPNDRYIGTVMTQETVMTQDQTFVWHVFEVTA